MCNSVKTGIKRMVAMIVALLMVLNVMLPVMAVTAYAADGGDYTITVKDKESGNALSGVNIEYTVFIKVDGVYEARRIDRGTTKEDGSLGINLREFSGQISTDGSINIGGITSNMKISYEATIEGYHVAEDEFEVTDLSGSYEIQMEKITHVMLTTDITGEGTVKFNGNIAEAWEIKYDDAEEVTIEVIPAGNYRIGSITIGGKEETITNTSKFSKTISNVKEDTLITVVFIETVTVTVKKTGDGTVTVDFEGKEDAEAGTVKGTVDVNGSFTVTAVAGENYRISEFRKGKDNNSETVVNFDTNDANEYAYTFENIESDCTVEVIFTKDRYKVSANVNAGGNVFIGEDEIGTEGKLIEHGTNVTVTVKPEDNYSIKSVKVNDVTEDLSSISDGDSYTITYTELTEKKDIVVEFVALYNITVETDSAYGVVAIEGLADKSITIREGETVKVIAASTDENYRVSEVKIGSIVYEYDTNGNSYSGELVAGVAPFNSQNTNVEVVFAKDWYNVSSIITNDEGGNVYIGDEVINTDGTMIDYDANVAITVKPYDMYAIKSVIVNDETQDINDVEQGAEFKIKYAGLSEAKRIEVEFIKLYTVSSSYNADEGSVTLEGGVVQDDGSVIVKEGESVDVNVTPATAYRIGSVTIDGIPQKVTDTASFSKTLDNVEKNIVVDVEFVKTYTMTVKTNGNGDIVTEPNLGTMAEGSVEGVIDKEGKFTVTATPNANYRVAEVKVTKNDTDSVTTIHEDNDAGHTEIIENIDADYMIEILFAKNRFNVSTVNEADGGGKVYIGSENNTSETLEHEESCSVTVVPDEEYAIQSITVKTETGEPKVYNSFGNDVRIYEYKVENITENTTIEVTFIKLYTLTVGYAEGQKSNGTVAINGQEGNSITIREGETVKVTATPKEDYRVLEVYKNGVALTDFVSANNKVYDATLKAGEGLFTDVNTEFTFEFAKNQFEIKTVVTPENMGTAVIEEANATTETVNYGDVRTIVITPANNYNAIESVMVNDKAVTVTASDDGSATIEVMVTEDTTVDVKFKVASEATTNDFIWNLDDAVRTAAPLYVFKEGATVTFTTTQEKIAIYGRDEDENYVLLHDVGENGVTSVAFDASTKISKIEIYYQATGEHNKAWHVIDVDYKLVIDTAAPGKMSLVPEEIEGSFSHYKEDVTVTINAEELEEDYSGLELVEYWVVVGEVEENYEPDAEDIIKRYTHTDTIENVFKGDIVISATEYNSDNVNVYLRVTDRAGNVSVIEKPLTLNINSTVPTVTVSIDGEQNPEALEGYYNGKRTATVVVEDRNTTFDKGAFKLEVTATEFNPEKPVEGNYKNPVLSEWTEIDVNTYKATIDFETEANYTWKLSYTNKAGCTVNEADFASNLGNKDVYAFTIDKTAPENVSIAIDENTGWKSLLSTLTFGLWKNKEITVTAEAVDTISPIQSIMYYKYEVQVEEQNGEEEPKDEPLSEEALNKLYKEGAFSTAKDAYTLGDDGKYVVYSRIMDNAGNVVYISTDGVVYDTTEGRIKLSAEYNEFGYNKVKDGKVIVNVVVNDLVESVNTSSGIKSIGYEVICDGIVTKTDSEYLLFKTDNPTYYQLTKTATTTIEVDAAENNSDNVVVRVTAYDNAGNVYEEQIELTINVTKPVATVEFDEKTANKIDEKLGYYKERTATITITDRATSFNAAKATEGIVVTAVDKDGKGIALTAEDVVISGWTSDGDKHTATVKFAKDAKYTWSFNYTNKADLVLDTANDLKSESDTPYYFVKDHTDPVGTISLSGAKWNESEGKYEEPWTDTWSIIVETLTFGLFSSDKIKVTASHVDDNPVIYECYKTDSTTLLKAEELDKLYADGEFEVYTDFDIPNDEQIVIYLRVTDYSGNYKYCSTNGSIMDKSDGRITFSSTGGTYNHDVTINVNVTDVIQGVKSYSGIKKIDYWVEKDNTTKTQSGVLYSFDIENPKHTDIKESWSGEIKVKAADNNSSDVKVYVRVTDNAGNEWVESTKVDIDITSPSLDVTFSSSESYYNAPCSATISITERSNHFDERNVSISVDATDAAGNKINARAYSLSGWSTSGGGNSDNATHTATIYFEADANYAFNVSFLDTAGNAANSMAFAFTVDTNKPTGEIKVATQEGAELNTTELQTDLTFDAYSREKITVSATYSDLTSKVASVQYYIDEVDGLEADFNVLTAEELDKVSTWYAFNDLVLTTDKKFVVYLKLKDNAGNYTYLSTRGLVLDKNAPIEELITPQITLEPENVSGDIYSDDVTIGIRVTDPIIEGSYAGIKTISYKVFDKAVSATNPTQQGVLYTFGINNPKQSDMLQLWTGEIVVDSKLNNSNEIVIEVYAEDNARNGSKNEVTIKIDKTAPAIDIAYDNNTADNGKYFKNNRTATITVTERNFNPDDVIVMITNTDGVIPTVGSWTKHAGTGNLDNTTWTAALTYDRDGDYTFDIAYTDMADNVCTDISYGISVAPVEFTIDKALPSVAVSYDNNTAMNNTYFNAGRTATVVITEHNFDINRVEFVQKASLNGTNITVPTASWAHEGDVHTAIIKYVSDGDYTFDVNVTDMAANKSNTVSYGNSKAPTAFTLDQTVNTVTISGIENGKAYKEDVIPEINFMDVNYDSYEVRLLHTSMGNKDVDVTSTFITAVTEDAQGGYGTYNTFEKVKENDGIYTLILTLTDKAGNSKTEKVVFTVNRFGSVYEYNNYLIDLISYGGKYVTELTGDLVITEYNADRLVSDSLNIEVTCDGKPIDEVLYDVTPAINALAEVGDSEWFQYQYTISKENFANDGIYKIAVSSKDATGNTPENNNYGSILFHVDNTAPEITSIVGFEESIVNAQELVAKYTVYDTIGLKSVKIFVDGNQFGEEITDFDIDINNYSGSFTLGESTEPQTVQIVVEDLAGNITDTASESFASAYVFNQSVTVSTNMLVRFYANKPLFWGSIGGTAAAATAAGVGLTIRRRKKLK